MADLSVVASTVRPLVGAIVRRATAGEILTPGMPVYVSGNGIVSKADGSALLTANCAGVVVSNQNGAVSFAAGDEMDVVVFGPVAGEWTNLAAGTRVYVDDDAGIMADAVGTKVCQVGTGWSTTVLFVNPVLSSSS